MTHTLAAVFDNRSDAEKARSALLGAGFKDGDVRLSDPAAGGTATQVQAQSEAGIGTSIAGGIKHFFTKLFGEDDDEIGRAYAEAIKRGNTVLTVQAENLDKVEHAADIVEGYGPVDIDERKSKWSAGGWTGGHKAASGGGQYAGSQQSAQGGTAGSGPSTTGSAAATSQSRQGETGGQPQQRAGTGAPDDPLIREELSIVSHGVLRGGARIYERVVTTIVRPLHGDSRKPRQGDDETTGKS